MGENKTLELIKTIVTAVLLVSLICLCSVYIFGFGKVRAAEFSKSMMSALKAQSYKSEYAKYFDRSYVVPEFIGVCSSDGRRKGMFSDTENARIETLYKSFSVYFSETLGENGKTSELDEDAGKRSWERALSGDCVYMSFRGELPRSLIYFMTFPDEITENVGDEFISELIIYPSGSPTIMESTDINGNRITSLLYAYSVIARNRHGGYYLFESTSVPGSYLDVYFNRDRIFSYNMTGALTFDFDGGDCRSGMFIKTEDLSAPEIFISGKDITANPVDISYITGAFGINYEKSVRYDESDGAVSYIEEGHNVKIYRDGRVIYTVTGDIGGVSMGVRLGDYAVYDYVGTAIKLIRAAEIDTGEATLKLRGIYKNGENVEVLFGYSCNNISISMGEEADLLRFEFKDGKLISAELTLLTAQSTKRYSACPQKWYSDIYSIEQSGEGRLVPFYTAAGDDNASGSVWLFARATEVSGK